MSKSSKPGILYQKIGFLTRSSRNTRQNFGYLPQEKLQKYGENPTVETLTRLEHDNREATLLLPPETRRASKALNYKKIYHWGKLRFFFKREPFCWASTHGELKTEDGAQTLRHAL